MKAIVHKEQSLSGVNNKSLIIASNDLSWTDTSILGKGVKDNMLIARSSSYSLFFQPHQRLVSMKSNAFNLIEFLNINEILDLQCLFHGRFDYRFTMKA